MEQMGQPAKTNNKQRGSLLILAVETSCDETSFALHDDTRLLSHLLFSQADIHSLYDGVVPELAARNHLQRLLPLLKECLRKANKKKEDITHVAYTMGPGLIAALMTGAAFARSLAYGLSVPAVGIHHLEGHILSPLLAEAPPAFPYLVLLASGGHTQLLLAKKVGDYVLHGESLDDAAGEAFDKTASLLGLNYPGGKELEELAQEGDPTVYKLTVPMRHTGDYNFSFSGLKTQVRYLAEETDPASSLLIKPAAKGGAKTDSRRGKRIEKTGTADRQRRADLAACFQETIVKSLLEKTFALAEELKQRRIVIVGGVSANSYLREEAQRKAPEKNVDVCFAPPEYCTDNAAMIALAASYRIKADIRDSLVIRAKARLPLPAGL